MAPERDPPPPIAVVGIGLRLPGGDKPCKQTVPSDYGYFLQDVNLKAFDASFFSMSRSEVEVLDPQQRLLLEVVWECMEGAGQTGWRGTNIGCYAGAFGEDWHDLVAMDTQAMGKFSISASDDFSLASRISFEFDLKGPCMTTRAACSSSLNGLHEACQALHNRDCSAAIVVGSSMMLSPYKTMTIAKQGVISPTGSCRTFDVAADGYARGEAITAILIKPLDEAIRLNDPIRAVIRSTAVNHDGKSKVIMMPSAEGQEALMRKAYKIANLEISQTPFVECHGTGTRIGDRIETIAVARVFGERGAYIGSVKPNVGHSEGASGITGLIKAILALENETIPPNINFSKPHPKLPLQQGKLEVPVEAIPWPKDRHARVSVNCFGAGGSNAHVIVDSAASFGLPRQTNSKATTDGTLNGHTTGTSDDVSEERPYLLPISANNAQSLQMREQSLRDYIQARPESLDGVAHTLGTRRDHMLHRAFCLANGKEEMLGFEGFQKDHTAAIGGLVFAFTGQGAQWAGMGKSLIHSSLSFRQDIRDMDRVLQDQVEPPQWTIEELLCSDNNELINKAEVSQLICTAMQIALVNLLKTYGITADAIVGHSSGEIAGAYTAGALTAAEAILCAYHRGIVAHETRKGSMAVVGLGQNAITPYLIDGAMVACVNSPTSVTISGDEDALKQTLEAVNTNNPGTFTRRLPGDIAYHSDYMRSVGEMYEILLKKCLSTKQGTIPFYSSVTGQRTPPDTVFGPAYWRESLESQVLFSSAVQAVLNDMKKEITFLEIGPHSVLKSPIYQISQEHCSKTPAYVPVLIKDNDSTISLLKAVGQLFARGYSVDFSSINPRAPILTDLPSYPWDHSSEFWNESRISLAWRQRKHRHHELLGSACIEVGDLEPAWRNLLRVADVPWLKDHKVAEDIVFPCAAYIAMMGEAIRQTTGSEAYMLRNLVIKSSLLVRESQTIEIVTMMKHSRLTDQANSSWHDISISSFNGSSWIQHCVAQGKSGQDYLPLERTISPYPRQISEGFWYERLQHSGLNYGPHFQGLRAISAHTKETKAVATLKNDRSKYGAEYSLHPITIDLCLQLFTVAATKGVSHHSETLGLPSSIAQVYVKPGDHNLIADAITRVNSKGFINGEVIAMTEEKEVIFELEEGAFTSWETKDEPDSMESIAAARLEWLPDIDFLAPGDLMRRGDNKYDSLKLVEKLTALCILKTLDTVTAVEISPGHLAKYASWLQQEKNSMVQGDWALLVPEAQQWASLDMQSRDLLWSSLVNELEQGDGNHASTIGRLYRRLSDSNNVRDIFLGKKNAIELLVEDDGLTALYNCYGGMVVSDEFFALCAHSQPTLKILEIGAGTGATTEEVLKALTLEDGTRVYAQYTFTDISSGFFASARERFKAYPRLEYKVLDISKDPATQGFDLGSYDLIVAANVLHATPSLCDTLRNVRSLLRTGGRLFLQEVVLPSQWRFPSFVVGLLPGWWIGENDGRSNDPRSSVERWDMELRNAGFSGADAAVLDNEQPYQINANIISVAVGPVTGTGGVIILYRNEKHEFAVELAGRCEGWGINVHWARLSDCEHIPDQDVISTIELEGPLFRDISPLEYQEVMSFLSKLSTGVLWLTGSAQVGCVDPGYGLTIGLARTIRSELLLDFTTVELQNLDSATVDATAAVFRKFQRRSSSADYDFEPEYAIHNDTILIGRYYWISASKELELSTQGSGPRCLAIARPGLIESLFWVQHESTVLQADEIEMDIHCAGLNYHDVLAAMGPIPSLKGGLGYEASGVITRIGSAIDHLKVGDRVVAMDGGCLSTQKVVNGQLVMRIPDHLSFEDAATMPIAYSTAIYSLFNIGQLAKGRSILIHAACGGVGLAVLQISKMLGAEIYATVGNEERVQFLIENYGLPRERIFHSRNDSFLRDIMQATGGRGVDLVLNSLSGELLHASWKCVAKYGKLIEIGKRDSIGRGQLMLDPFEDNRSFSGIDLKGIGQDRPGVITKLMEQCIEYYEQGHIKPILPIKIFPAERAGDAFRYMQKGGHIGKIIIAVKDTKQISAVGARKQLELSDKLTYLMVGGLGGLGKALATWMVEHGARSFVFLARSAGESDEDQAFFQELRSQGCTAVAVSGSVVEFNDVKRAIAAAPMPIGGVIQLAMVLRDLPLLEISHDDWATVQGPKVKGTWNLHEALEGFDLDFFILLSSVSGLSGHPGQASYASASAFLDSFVQYRHSLHLPCSVVDIGIVQGVGYVSRNSNAIRQLRDAGMYILQPRDLMDAIEISIRKSHGSRASSGPRSKYCSLGQLAIGFKSSKPLSDPANLSSWKRDIRMGVYRLLESTEELMTASDDSGLQVLLQSAATNPDVLHQTASLELATTVIGRTLSGYIMQPEENLGLTTPLSSVGIDSLVGIELRNWFRRALGVDISILELASAGTVERLGRIAIASLVDKYGASQAMNDLGKKEGRRAPPLLDLASEFASYKSAPWELQRFLTRPVTTLPDEATVFLTGATGYLGIEILRQLLRQNTVKTVAVLVRAKSTQHAMDRLRDIAQAAGWWCPNDEARIEVWVGDLDRSDLGLNDAQTRRLRGESSSHSNINVIIHNGAVVNWTASYETLRRPNIGSTTELLQITASSPIFPKFIYVSGGTNRSIQELSIASAEDSLSHMGYFQTKIMAEGIVLEIASRLPAVQNRVSVIKPGLIIGTAEAGVANANDFLWRGLATAAALQAFPVDDSWIHVVSMDTVAERVVEKLLTTKGGAAFVDMQGGMPMAMFWDIVNQELEPACSPVTWERWIQLAKGQIEAIGEQHPLWALQHVIDFRPQLDRPPAVVEVDAQLRLAVRMCVRYLIRIGFIKSSGKDMGER
ncbi:Highly reducing polyketide synthase gloL [Cladobotryum mycophilum]|uniref:Highly reducing polyketide synthase gloL n=1 Tax=Cladobotryum mycophilum TaxID=491253 RepID=A0ABR0SHE3_9HYPO